MALNYSGFANAAHLKIMDRRNWRIFLLSGNWRNPGRLSAQCLKISSNIGGLALCQSQVRHCCFRFHRGRRLNPTSEVRRGIWKLSGNKGTARHFVERGTKKPVSVVDAGDRMTLSTTKVLYDRLTMLGRSGNCGLVTLQFLPSGTSGEKTGRYDQAEETQAGTHIKIGCRITSKPFSRISPTFPGCRRFRRIRRPKVSGIQGYVKRQSPQRCPIPANTGAILGLFLAACIFVPGSFGQQVSSSGPLEGRQVFQQRCAGCHGERGEGISAAVTYAGPSLQAEHNPGEVMTAVETGPEHMPRFEYVLSVEQMRAVAQYVTQKLAVIPLTGGNLTDGGELFRTYCATCHRTAVRGGALGFVGTNAPSLKDKSAALIAGAIRWGPGPMPSFPSSVLSDEQVASIVQYIRVVQHPAHPGGDPMKWYGPTSEGFAAWVILLVLILFAMWAERGGQG